MLIPSSAVESMGMGGLMGAAALQQARLVWTMPVVVGAILAVIGWARWAGAQEAPSRKSPVSIEPIGGIRDALGGHDASG